MNWISVKNKLPEENQYCLCYCTNRPAMPYLIQRSWGIEMPNGFWDQYITHYILLKPPEVKE